MLNFIKGFGYALNGLVVFFKNERNGQIQLFAAIMALAAGFFFHLSRMEWIVIILCIAIVLSLEMINSAIEKFCNMVNPAYHPSIKIIKDITAAAVLWAAVASAIIGLLIFWPKVAMFF